MPLSAQHRLEFDIIPISISISHFPLTSVQISLCLLNFLELFGKPRTCIGSVAGERLLRDNPA